MLHDAMGSLPYPDDAGFSTRFGLPPVPETNTPTAFGVGARSLLLLGFMGRTEAW